MQIKMLASGLGPDYYRIDGEKIKAFSGQQSVEYDLSALGEGDELSAPAMLGDIPVIRAAWRTNGIVFATLAQRVDGGMWTESGYFDASTYDPSVAYVRPAGSVVTFPGGA